MNNPELCAVCSCGCPAFIIKEVRYLYRSCNKWHKPILNCECADCGKLITISPKDNSK